MESVKMTQGRRRIVAVAALALVANFLLPVSPAYAVDGQITGTVSSSQGGNLSGVTVRLFSDDGVDINFVTSTVTDGSGAYSFSSLAYTNYVIEVWGSGATPPHADQFHDGTYSLNVATNFPVSNSTPVVRNITMSPGGTISGTLTGEFGVPANPSILLFHYIGGNYMFNLWTPTVLPDGTWEAPNLAPGDWAIRYTDLLPSATNYRTEYHGNILDQDFQEYVSLSAGGSVAVSAVMTEAGPIPTQRLSGSDRYATAIAVSNEFDPFNAAPATYVYIASGANYPDALSAAPAAAKREAPLLLTPPTALPAAVAAEITRLDPENIIVAGGPGAVSNAVFTALQGLIDDPAKVVRIGGANRYETSRLLVEDAWDNALTAFVATGRNFPDALAAGAAAGFVGGPVILVDGNASTLDVPTRTLIDSLGVETVYIAGSSAVVTNGIQTNLGTIPGVVDVTRLGGSDRYATSLAINQEIFSTTVKAYLATGTGFADALAGAALAGANAAPLYTVLRTCIPDGVHTHFRTIEVDELYLLGGPSVLSAGVANLARC